MGKPIAMEVPARDPKRELMARLEAAPAEHAAALLDGYELLQALHDSGLLMVARGAIGAGTKIVDTAAEGANTPEAIRALRNAIVLGKMLGAIDPDLLARVAAAAGETFGDAPSLPAQPPGLFTTLRMLTGRDVRMAVGWMSAFLGRVTQRGGTKRGSKS